MKLDMNGMSVMEMFLATRHNLFGLFAWLQRGGGGAGTFHSNVENYPCFLVNSKDLAVNADVVFRLS